MIFGAAFRLMLGILATLAALPAAASEWGDLRGRFVVDGETPPPAMLTTPGCTAELQLFDESLLVGHDGGLKNALIFLRTKDVPVAPGYAKSAADTITLDNKQCRFDPHVLVLRTTQRLRFSNSDAIAHTNKLDPLLNPAINTLLLPAGEAEESLETEEALPIKVGCNMHPWMGAWVLVRNSPYAAVSQASGAFELKDLPVGVPLEFQLWHERTGYLKNADCQAARGDARGRLTITLKPGLNDLGAIKISARLFR